MLIVTSPGIKDPRLLEASQLLDFQDWDRRTAQTILALGSMSYKAPSVSGKPQWGGQQLSIDTAWR